MKIRYVALLLLPVLIALCGAGFGPQIVKGPMPSNTAVTTWAPTNVAGAVFWGVCSNVVQDGANAVSTWLDASGLENDALFSTAKARYSNAIPALNMYPYNSNGGNYTNVLGTTYSQPNTIVVVAMLRAGGSTYNQQFVDSRSVAARQIFAIDVDPYGYNRLLLFAGTWLASPNGTTIGLTNRWVIYTATFAGANSLIRTNGVLLVSGNAGTQDAGNGFTLFDDAQWKSFYVFGGLCRELIWYNSSISSNDIFTVERNLARKWGITNTVVPGD